MLPPLGPCNGCRFGFSQRAKSRPEMLALMCLARSGGGAGWEIWRHGGALCWDAAMTAITSEWSVYRLVRDVVVLVPT